jgi:hypothetical protein
MKMKIFLRSLYYGLVGFIDPLRGEAKVSVEQCRDAGYKGNHDNRRSPRNGRYHSA